MNELDTQGLVAAIAIAAILSTLGYGVDKSLRERQRNAISELIFSWWYFIEKLRLPDVSRAMAETFLKSEQKIFGPKMISVRWIFTTMIVSVALTTTALVFGDFLFWYNDLSNAAGNIANHKPTALYPLNYFFDVLTLLVTIFVLRMLVKFHAVTGIAFVILDILFAISLAFICYIIAASLEFPKSTVLKCCPIEFQPHYFRGNLQFYLGYFIEIFSILRSVVPQAEVPPLAIGQSWFTWRPIYGGDVANFAVANTSILPTVGYLIVLLFVSFSFATVRIVRAIALHFFALDVETDKSLFFYTGVLLGLITAVGKLAVEILKLVA